MSWSSRATPSRVADDVIDEGVHRLAVANTDNNTMSVLVNNGNGTFAGKVDYPTGTSPLSVTAVDVSGDGKPDLCVANFNGKTVSLLFNVCLP